jgi:succinate dehydrogenase / fumarate reductase cytochrome b subunit
MGWITRFLFSNIGMKVLMALTGMLMVVFVIVHMVGNLQVFLGPEALDHYGAMLQGLGDLLWLMRIGLIVSVLVHIAAAAWLWVRKQQARGKKYQAGKYWLATSATSLYSRTMLYGGIFLALFIIVHLGHLTTGHLQPETFEHCMANAAGVLECSVYANVVHGFSVWWMSLLYIVSMVFLGMHLGHGAWSMFRTLGLESDRYDRLARAFAVVVGIGIFAGNSIIPLAVLTGVVHL